VLSSTVAMTVKELRCPHCGGAVDFKEGSNRGICSFCGFALVYEPDSTETVARDRSIRLAVAALNFGSFEDAAELALKALENDPFSCRAWSIRASAIIGLAEQSAKKGDNGFFDDITDFVKICNAGLATVQARTELEGDLSKAMGQVIDGYLSTAKVPYPIGYMLSLCDAFDSVELDAPSKDELKVKVSNARSFALRSVSDNIAYHIDAFCRASELTDGDWRFDMTFAVSISDALDLIMPLLMRGGPDQERAMSKIEDRFSKVRAMKNYRSCAPIMHVDDALRSLNNHQ
jgi:hypothetical protein